MYTVSVHLYYTVITGSVHLNCTVLTTGAKPHSQDGDGRGAPRGVAAGAGGPRPGAQRPPAAGADPRPRGGQQPRRPRAGLTSSPYKSFYNIQPQRIKDYTNQDK